MKDTLLRRLVLSLALLYATGCHDIESVTPTVAAPGDTVIIAGRGFGAVQGVTPLTYRGEPMDVVSWSDREIRARIPAGTPDGVHELRIVKTTDIARATHTTAGPFAVFDPVFEESPENILAGWLRFETSRPASVAVSVRSADERFDVPASAIQSSGSSHAALILGLESGTAFTFELAAQDGSAAAVNTNGTHTPGALPFLVQPPIEVRALERDEMEPGLTLLGLNRTPSPVPTVFTSHVVAIDAEGDVRWYSDLDGASVVEAVERSASGHFFAMNQRLSVNGDIVELDLLGNVVRRIDLPGPDTFHHDVVELPNGNYLALGTELRRIGGFPDGNGSTTWNIVGDTLVEVRRDGSVVRVISFFDFLSPYRYVDTDVFHLPFWTPVYGVVTKDWTHCNGLVYDPVDDAAIVSCRHQDMIMKIGLDPVEWIWAIGKDWPTPHDDDYPFLDQIGPGYVPNHQHAPHLRANGNVMVYDNGNERPEVGSAGTEYAIDENAGTFEQVWRWVDPDYDPPVHVSFTGDADPLPGGTVLIADTGMADDTTSPFIGFRWMRLAEVRASDQHKVWELWIENDPRIWSWTGFDAERISSLYPGQ